MQPGSSCSEPSASTSIAFRKRSRASGFTRTLTHIASMWPPFCRLLDLTYPRPARMSTRTPASIRMGPCASVEAGMVSLTQFIVWLIVGLLGGSIAGLIVRRERRGFGVWRNLGLGLAGAVVGGLLFWLLGLFPGLDRVRISLRDVVAAIVGSFLVLGALTLWQRWKGSS